MGATATKERPIQVDPNGLRPGKVGIMFLNLGGPEKLDEVEDFLFNLFNDEDIIRLPNPVKPLQPFIARDRFRRAPGSREAYESIGGGSPIVKLTQEQGDNLVNTLGKRGIDAKVYIGMRYWYPFTEEATDKLLEDGINRLVMFLTPSTLFLPPAAPSVCWTRSCGKTPSHGIPVRLTTPSCPIGTTPGVHSHTG